MEIKTYHKLPNEAADIRKKVFVDEQKFSIDLEFDENENTATHLVGYINSNHAATARYFFSPNLNGYLIGRIAVLKEYRKMKLGSEIVRACEEQIKLCDGKDIYIHAQSRVKAFYESLGYKPEGEPDFEEGVEHIMMHKSVNQ